MRHVARRKRATRIFAVAQRCRYQLAVVFRELVHLVRKLRVARSLSERCSAIPQLQMDCQASPWLPNSASTNIPSARGENSFDIVGVEEHGAMVQRQKNGRAAHRFEFG